MDSESYNDRVYNINRQLREMELDFLAALAEAQLKQGEFEETPSEAVFDQDAAPEPVTSPPADDRVEVIVGTDRGSLEKMTTAWQTWVATGGMHMSAAQYMIARVIEPLLVEWTAKGEQKGWFKPNE